MNLGSPRDAEKTSSRLIREGVPQPQNVAWFVVFALNRILRAPVVEAEYFVGEIQSCNDDVQPSIHPKTSLRIDLGVSVEIGVPVRALDAERHVIWGSVWIQVLVVVTEDVGVVVRNSQTRRDSPAIECRTDIPRVRCLPLQ